MFPKHLPPLPDLPTLHARPSWCNFRGHVDRSACIELPAPRCMSLTMGEPFTPAPTVGGRVSATIAVMPSTWLDFLMNKHWDRSRLNGDYRVRAWAMRPDPRDRMARLSRRGKPLYHPGTHMRANGPDQGLSPNPNRGNCRTKTHGLPLEWTQPLALEKWRVRTVQPGDRLGYGVAKRGHEVTRMFLVCPGLERPLPREDQLNLILPVGVPQPWLLQMSTAERGKLRRSVTNPGYDNAVKDRDTPCRAGDPRRVSMLLLPQAHPQEIADAAVAQAWLAAVAEARGDYPGCPPRLTTLELQVIERYRPLFTPRRLLCAHCLGVRWGQVRPGQIPESRRGYFVKHERPKITFEKVSPVMRQLNKDWKLVKAYHKSVKRTQKWIDLLAYLQAETDPQKIVDCIDKHWGNPHRAQVARKRKRKGLPDRRKALEAFFAQIDREDGIK